MQKQLAARLQDHHRPAHLRRARLHHAGGRRSEKLPHARRDELLVRARTHSLGGRAAEQADLRHRSRPARPTTSSSATELARNMVTQLRHEPTNSAWSRSRPLRTSILPATPPLTCSAETAAQIDEEVIATVKAAHEKAIKILQDNTDAAAIDLAHLSAREGDHHRRRVHEHAVNRKAAPKDGLTTAEITGILKIQRGTVGRRSALRVF